MSNAVIIVRRYNMKQEYIDDINKLLAQTTDLSLLDFVYRFLRKSVA